MSMTAGDLTIAGGRAGLSAGPLACHSSEGVWCSADCVSFDRVSRFRFAVAGAKAVAVDPGTEPGVR
jgi:hypothetical protein